MPRPRPIERPPARPEPPPPLAEPPPPIRRREVGPSPWMRDREERTDKPEPEPKAEVREPPVEEPEAEPVEPEAVEPEPELVEDGGQPAGAGAEEIWGAVAEAAEREALKDDMEAEAEDDKGEPEEEEEEFEEQPEEPETEEQLVAEEPPAEEPADDDMPVEEPLDEPPVEEPPIEEPPVEEPPIGGPEDELALTDTIIDGVNGYPADEADDLEPGDEAEVDEEPEPGEEPEPEAEEEPGPEAEEEPGPEAEEEPEPEAEQPTLEDPAVEDAEPFDDRPGSDDQPTVEIKALRHGDPPPLPGPQRVTITDVVDDLLAPGGPAEEVVEANVVEQAVASGYSREDAELAESVRSTLAAYPGLLTGTVEIEVVDGTVQLHGWIARIDVAGEIERVAAGVPGVMAVQSFLRLRGA